MLRGVYSRLRGKVAVVRGASAENGSGWVIAEALAAEGAKVVVGARSAVPLHELATRIAGHAVVCDSGNIAHTDGLAREAVAAFGPIDIAVNAAAHTTFGLIADTPPEEL